MDGHARTETHFYIELLHFFNFFLKVFSLFHSLEIMKEDNIRLKKQSEQIEGERDLAIHERNGLKQQCTAAIRQVNEINNTLCTFSCNILNVYFPY